MENIIILNLIVSTISFVFILYFLNKLLKTVHLIYQSSQADNKSPIESPVDYGYKKGSTLPSIKVFDPNIKKEINLKINNSSETVILMTAVGCAPCENTITKLSDYSWDHANRELIVFSFIPPEGIKEEETSLHTDMVNKITKKHYLINEEVIYTLDIKIFPTILWLASDNKVIGTYSGHIDTLKNLFNIRINKKVS